jgi:hypothetical protein
VVDGVQLLRGLRGGGDGYTPHARRVIETRCGTRPYLVVFCGKRCELLRVLDDVQVRGDCEAQAGIIALIKMETAQKVAADANAHSAIQNSLYLRETISEI